MPILWLIKVWQHFNALWCILFIFIIICYLKWTFDILQWYKITHSLKSHTYLFYQSCEENYQKSQISQERTTDTLWLLKFCPISVTSLHSFSMRYEYKLSSIFDQFLAIQILNWLCFGYLQIFTRNNIIFVGHTVS